MTFNHKGYVIPDEPEPEGEYCLTVYIPRDVVYLRNFLGALDFFGKWLAHDDGGDGRAKLAADRWKASNELTRAAYAEGNCVENMPATRINPTTCLFEVDCSGDGTDWQPVFTPAYDPTNDAPPVALYPDAPPEGETNECLAAENVTAFFQNGTGQFATLLGADGIIGEIVALLYTMLSGLVAMVQANLWFTLLEVDWGDFDSATIEADYAAFDWDTFKNLIVCYFNGDGQMTPASHLEALNEMEGHAGQIWRAIRLVWSLAGSIGVSLATRWAGITDGTCETCNDFVHTDDMTTGMHGWSFVPFPADDPYDPSATLGEWDSNGAHITISATQPAGAYRLLMAQEISNTVINTIRVVSGFSTGTNTTEVWRVAGGVRTQINGSVSRDPMDSVACGLYGTGADVLFDCGGLAFDEVQIYISSAASDGWICEVVIEGMGTDPFAA